MTYIAKSIFAVLVFFSSAINPARCLTQSWVADGPWGAGGNAFHSFSFHTDPNIIFLSASGVFRSNSFGALWKRTGLHSGFHLIRTVKSSGEIFALSMSGSSVSVYHSTDTGQTWSLAGSSTFQIDGQSSLQDFEIDPHNESIFYIAISGGGIFKSQDSGRTWQKKSNGLPNLFVGHLELSNGAPNLLYLLLDNGSFYVSVNGGEVWMRSSNGLRLRNGRAIKSNPRNQQDVYVAGQAKDMKAGLFKSENGGKSWIGLTSLPYDVSRIAIDPLNPRNIYVIAGGRPAKSTDAGLTWKNLDVPERAIYTEEIEVHPNSPNYVYISSRSGFYRSSNGGITWIAVNQRIDNQGVQELQSSTVLNKTTYYALTGYPEVFSSGKLSNWNFLFRSKIDSLDGRTFRPNHVLLHRLDPKVIVLSSEANGIVVKSAGNWEYRSSPAISEAVFHPSASSTLFVAGLSDSVQKTTNLGKTWVRIGAGLPGIEDSPAERDIIHMAIDPINNNTMYVSNIANVYRSTNGGQLWVRLNREFDFIRDIEVTKASTVFIATSSSLYRSMNKGQNWERLKNAPGNVSFIRANPRNPSELFGGGGPIYLFHTRDKGNNWVPFTTNGLPSDVYIYDLLFDLQDSKKILIGTSRGVFHFVRN